MWTTLKTSAPMLALRGDGPLRGRRPILLQVLVATLVIASTMVIGTAPAYAATGTVRPDGTASAGWAVCTATPSCLSAHHTAIDETSPSDADYVGTGTGGANGDTEIYDMTSVTATTSDPVTSIVVTFRAWIVGTCLGSGGNCDTLTVGIRIDGGATINGAVQALTAGTPTTFTRTFNGNWTGDQDLQVVVMRTAVGGGGAGSNDDSVALSYVDAVVTYTPLLPSLSVNDVTVTEGNSGSANATFTVTSSASWASDVTVAYATSDGTATAGSDYTASSGTATITAGQTSTTFTVPILGDTDYESAETFNVTLSSPTNAVVGDGTGVGTISNDDPLPLEQSGFRAYANGDYLARGDSVSNLTFSLAEDSTYLYVGGRAFDGAWRIEKRLRSTNVLESGFGTSGVITGPVGGTAKAVAIDATYMYIVGRSAANGWLIEKRNLSNGAAVAGFAPGSLATGTAANQGAEDIVIDSTYMYVTGSSSTDDWRTEKRNLSDGSLVSAFGTNGVVSGVTATHGGLAIAIDADAVYVAGTEGSAGVANYRIEKLDLTTGSPVSGFGTSGVVSGDTGSRSIRRMLVGSDDMYLVGSDDFAGGGWRTELRNKTTANLKSDPLAAQDTAPILNAGDAFRLRTLIHSTAVIPANAATLKLQVAPQAGTCDAAFAGETYADVQSASGSVRFKDNASGIDGTSLVAADGDPVHSGHGNIAQTYEEANNFTNPVAMTSNSDSLWEFALTVDSLANSGAHCLRVVDSAGIPLSTYSSIARICISSCTAVPTSLTQGAYRWFSNVNPQSTFGTNGVVTTGMAQVRDIAMDDTYMYAVGQNGSPDWKIEKRQISDGALDTNFGTNGVVTAASLSQYGNEIAIDSTYMYVGGNDSTVDWRIEKRLLSNGSLVGTFGTSGVVTSASDSQSLDSLIIDDIYMYAGGSTASGYYRIEKRLLSDGSLVNGFGSSGLITGSTSSRYVYGLVIVDGYLYAAGNSRVPGWRIERRSLTTGALVSGWGTGGVIMSDTVSDSPYGFATDGTYFYLAGYDTTADWRIEKRLVSNGSLVSGFGTNGVVTSDANSTQLIGFAIDATSMYVGGTAVGGGRIEKRSLSDGSLVSGFGTGGIVSTTAMSYSLTVDSNYVYYEVDATSATITRRTLSAGTTTLAVVEPVAAQDTALTAASSQPISVRVAVGVDADPLQSGSQFKLRYATRAGAACGGGDESFSDVVSGSGAIRFYDNSGFSDGSAFVSNAGDPVYAGRTNTGQSYEEAGGLPLSTSVGAGGAAIWNFSLATVGAAAGTTYCLAVTWSDGTALDSYTVYPQLTIPGVAPAPVNSAPNEPTNLLQKTSTPSTLNTGDWTFENQVFLSADATDPDSSDTLKLCAEVKTIASSLDGSGLVCGNTANYSGSAVTLTVNVTGLSNSTEYQWQVRVVDAATAASTFALYGSNGAGVRDFGVDTTVPSGGTVYDGTVTDSDAEYNGGSLSSLSANWSGVTFGASGVKRYQIAIGKTPGADDVKAWSDNSPLTDAAATVSALSLRTGQKYYVSVLATSNAGLTGSAITSNGQEVEPMFSFGITTPSVSFGQMVPGGAPRSTIIGLLTSTNAYGGYQVTVKTTNDFSSGSQTIGGFDGATPGSTDAYLGSDTGLGFSSDDSLVSGVNLFQPVTCPGGNTKSSPGCFASLTTSPQTAVDHEGPFNAPVLNQPWNVFLKLRAPSSQPDGTYTTTVVLTAIPTF